jgi:hypothetical protein
MIKHELCPSCRPIGYCKFENTAETIASSVKVEENHEELFHDAYQASIKIAVQRIVARERSCRHLNNIDPNYPGKNLL